VLAIYSGGKRSEFTGSGLPVSQWHFTATGRQVAFQQETAHGGREIHYELRDIGSGVLVAEYSPKVDEDGQPLEEQSPPDWVVALDNAATVGQ
jgi:hypothetical protein